MQGVSGLQGSGGERKQGLTKGKGGGATFHSFLTASDIKAAILVSDVFPVSCFYQLERFRISVHSEKFDNNYVPQNT